MTAYGSSLGSIANARGNWDIIGSYMSQGWISDLHKCYGKSIIVAHPGAERNKLDVKMLQMSKRRPLAMGTHIICI